MLMYSGTRSRRQDELMHLRRAVETELDRGPFCIGLKAPLRDTYRAATAAARSRELVTTCQCGSLLYLLAVLLANLLSSPAPMWLSVAAQCCVVPFVALTIAYVSFRPENPVFLRESGAFAAAACFILATLLAVCAGHGELEVLNLFLVSLSAIAALFFVQLRLPAAMALVGLTGLALCLAVSTRADVPPNLRGYPLGFLLAVSAPALISVHQRERAARLAYLQTLLLDVRIEQLGFERGIGGTVDARVGFGLLALRAGLRVVLVEHAPADRDDDQTARNLHDRQRDSEDFKIAETSSPTIAGKKALLKAILPRRPP